MTHDSRHFESNRWKPGMPTHCAFGGPTVEWAIALKEAECMSLAKKVKEGNRLLNELKLKKES